MNNKSQDIREQKGRLYYTTENERPQMSPEVLGQLKTGVLMNREEDESCFSSPVWGGGRDLKCYAHYKPIHKTDP